MDIEFKIDKEAIAQFKKRRLIRAMVNNAIRKGEIVRPDKCDLCQLNEGGIDAHHKDYGRPFDIVWLCCVCHGLVHRKSHELNPNNNIQTPLPRVCDQNSHVTISFTLPVANFLALKQDAIKQGKSISKVIREQTVSRYIVNNDQLEFNFEARNDNTLNEKIERIRHLETDETIYEQPKFFILQKIPEVRGDGMRRMEGIIQQIPFGYGSDTRRLYGNTIN
jgi:hypothetical protein